MYDSFVIDSFIHFCVKKYKNLHSKIFILPTDLCISVFKYKIKKLNYSVNWMPYIYTIESFVEYVSNVKINENVVIYNLIYNFIKKKKYNIFSSFSHFIEWASYIIDVLNIIDLNFLNIKIFLSYYISNSSFTKKDIFYFLYCLYNDNIKDFLLQLGVGYKGLVFNTAYNLLNLFNNHVIFLFSKILNKCELFILKKLRCNKKIDIYWNLNINIYNDVLKKEIKYYYNFLDLEESSINYVSQLNYTDNVTIVSVEGYTHQIRYINNIIYKLSSKNFFKKKIGIILTDDSLITPLIHLLPCYFINKCNFNIIYKLNKVPVYDTFLKLFYLYINRIKLNQFDSFNYIDVYAFISDFFIKHCYSNLYKSFGYSTIFNTFSLQYLKDSLDSNVIFIFNNTFNNVYDFINIIENISNDIKNKIFNNSNFLQNEYNQKMSLNFLDILNCWIYHIRYNQDKINSINELYTLYVKYMFKNKHFTLYDYNKHNIITNIYNTCCLDFDLVFILSANEGNYPPLNSMVFCSLLNSLNKYSLYINKFFNLYYFYLFFNILKNSKKVYLLYDKNLQHYNKGESSRYVKYIKLLKNINFTFDKVIYIINENRVIDINNTLYIKKNIDIVNKLKIIGEKGFSPYSINLYFNNPFDFYTRFILGINNNDINIHEYVDSKLIGYIFHKVIYNLYFDYQNSYLTIRILKYFYNIYLNKIRYFFHKAGLDCTKGKYLIIFNILKYLVKNVIDWDVCTLKKGYKILLKYLEYDMKNLLFKYNNYNIYITGRVDRIDIVDNYIRIIDYKTSNYFFNKKLFFHINKNYNFFDRNKNNNYIIIQLMFYAFLFFNCKDDGIKIESGIFNCKNFNIFNNNSWMPLIFDVNISDKEIFNDFRKQLINIISEILNDAIPFINLRI